MRIRERASLFSVVSAPKNKLKASTSRLEDYRVIIDGIKSGR